MQVSLLPSHFSPKSKPKNPRCIVQVAYLQNLIVNAIRDGEQMKPLELASLARAWCDLNEERRKLKMKPLPKSVDASTFGKRKKKPVEPVVVVAQPKPVEPVKDLTPDDPAYFQANGGLNSATSGE